MRRKGRMTLLRQCGNLGYLTGTMSVLSFKWSLRLQHPTLAQSALDIHPPLILMTLQNRSSQSHLKWRNRGYRAWKLHSRTRRSRDILTLQRRLLPAPVLEPRQPACTYVMRHNAFQAHQATEGVSNGSTPWSDLERKNWKQPWGLSSSPAARRAEPVAPLREGYTPWEVSALSSNTLSACHAHLLPFCRALPPLAANLEILAWLHGPEVAIQGRQLRADWSVAWKESSAHGEV